MMKSRLIFIFCLSIIFLQCKNFSKPTFSKDVASIIYKNCTPCHRPNQIGHFSLLTYKDVQSRAKIILYTVVHNIMPPWPADAHYTSFANQMVLSEAEKNTIKLWVENDCPIGDSNNIPSPPIYKSRSFLGEPDLVIPISPIAIKNNFKDQFLLIKVPFALPENNLFASAIEIVPGNTKVLHHINADLVRYEEEAKKQNLFDGDWIHNTINDSTVRDAYKKMGLLYDNGSYPVLSRNAVNYLPGVIAQKYPSGIGSIKLSKKNAFLLSDAHYGPSANNTWDSSYINIYLTKTPPTRNVLEFQLGTLGIAPIEPPLIIYPDSVMKFVSKLTLPEAISVVMLNPHMHLLGKSFWAFGVQTTGDTIPLIKIPKWDFNWQNYYKPNKPIVLKAGTIIYAIGVYDNTINNPFNPNKPPKIVTDKNGSMRTTDEMFQFIVNYMSYEKGDEDLSLQAK